MEEVVVITNVSDGYVRVGEKALIPPGETAAYVRSTLDEKALELLEKDKHIVIQGSDPAEDEPVEHEKPKRGRKRSPVDTIAVAAPEVAETVEADAEPEE